MNDIRRTILWVIFGFSLVMLWDQWQVYNGKQATFFPSGKPAATATAPAAGASAPGCRVPAPTTAAARRRGGHAAAPVPGAAGRRRQRRAARARHGQHRRACA